MKNTIRDILICLFVFIGCSQMSVSAQMEVTPASQAPLNPTNLISNVFLGEGVEVTNISYDGNDNAVGQFSEGQDIIGIDRGIVMTTGRATSVTKQSSEISEDDNNSFVTDQDLQSIVGSDVKIENAAKYEITFIPNADTVRFKYVWASEEYPEYVCSQFNDVFGFFISGPDINGPYQNNAINIALIPDTDLPVSINSINGGTPGSFNGGNCSGENESLAYSEYFVNNDSNNQPVYNGFTKVLTAQAVVTPCVEYTIKLVIADASDASLDSGVFLEAKSFGANNVSLTKEILSIDNTIVEGCTQASLAFSIANAKQSDFPIDLTIEGTAQNGVDYEEIPNALNIPAGQKRAVIDIVGIEDGIDNESIETVQISFQLNECDRDTVLLFVKDNGLIAPQLQNDTFICTSAPIALDATSSTPIPEPKQFMSTEEIEINPVDVPKMSIITVSDVQPDMLIPEILGSICINIDHSIPPDLDVFLIVPNGAVLELTTDNGIDFQANFTNTCFSVDASTSIRDGIAPFTGEYEPEGDWNDIWGSPVNGEWQLIVTDDSNGFVGNLLGWSINFNPTYSLEYTWDASSTLSCTDCPNPVATPTQTETYTVTVTDSYGCTATDQVRISLDDIDIPEIMCDNSEQGSITFSWESVGATSYEVSIDNGTAQTPNGDDGLSHTVSGLGLEQSVDFELMIITDCGTETTSTTCQSAGCDDILLQLENQQNLSCFDADDGSVELSVSNGLAPYTFRLNGQSNSSGNFTDLAAGGYTAVVTDANNCTKDLALQITHPDQLLVNNSTPMNASCNGGNDGEIQIELIGGTAPYTVTWAGISQTGTDIKDLPAGTYTANIVDAQGCIQSHTATVDEDPIFDYNANQTDVSCNGNNDGTLEINLDDNYTYVWSGPNGYMEINRRINQLEAGAYSVTVTNLAGCAITKEFTITEPTAIQTSDQTTDATCSGDSDGSLTITPSAGVAPYEYSLDGQTYQPENTFRNLTAGQYNYTVKDANGCTQSGQAIVDEPEGIEISFASTSITVDVGQSAELNPMVNRNSDDIATITWSPTGDLSCIDCLNPIASPKNTTDYTITIVDRAGCSATAAIKVIIDRKPSIFVANIFKPSTGANGFVTIYTDQYVVEEIELFEIYDRWGSLIYSEKNRSTAPPTSGWDGTFNGKDAEQGVYVWVAKLKLLQGTVETRIGDITLIR